MALAQLEFIQRVRNRLKPAGIDMKPDEVESVLSMALLRLGERVAQDPFHRVRLQAPFSDAITAGFADLSGGGFATLKVSHVRYGRVIHPGSPTAPLQFLPNRQDLDYPPPTPDFYFYAIFQNGLYAVDYTGANVPDATLTITSSYNPSLAQVPVGLTAMLVDIGVELCMESQSPAVVTGKADGDTQEAA